MRTVTEIKDAATWDASLLALPYPHILQSWAWGATKTQTGWSARRLLWEEDGKPVAAAAMLVRRLRLLQLPAPVAVAYVPKGPLLNWSDAPLRRRVLDELVQEARRAGAIFVKIDPDVNLDTAAGEAVMADLAVRGWQASREQIQFRNTMVSDLTPDEATLLAQMKPKWRYNIRLAERKGLVVRGGTAADLPAFYAMYVETGTRDGFIVRPFEYYRSIWEPFLAQNLAHLLLAEPGDDPDGHSEPVAGIILFRFGPTTWYFYGASTAHSRPLMPNHALQWAAMRWAKAAGCTRYDWWGAPDVLDESDAMWGVYRFKQGFGGTFTRSIGAYDFACSPRLYWLYRVGMPRLLEIARQRHRARVSGPQTPSPVEETTEGERLEG